MVKWGQRVEQVLLALIYLQMVDNALMEGQVVAVEKLRLMEEAQVTVEKAGLLRKAQME